MDGQWLQRVAIAALLIFVWLSWGPFVVGPHESATVTITTESGTVAVDAEVADAAYERYKGLSGRTSLPDKTGMLFVHDSAANRTYVMREMVIPIDIIFIDANGTITAINAAELPENHPENRYRYPGYGKYVLEVPYSFHERHNVSVGDSVDIRY